VTDIDRQNLAMKSARLRIWRGTDPENSRYEEFDVEFEEGDSVLDALVRLRYGVAPDLAFPFSCFNANVCKECVMMIDGIVDYACIAKIKPGLVQLDPVPDQHILRDLMVDVRERDQKSLTLRHLMLTIGERRRNAKDRSPSEPTR
jgi:succinate dehydrogenase/fumarate reductase-like Fe-S protein